MALLTGWTGKEGYTGQDNKDVRQKPATRTVRTLVTVGITSLWQIETITTESYSFTGMTEATADACAAAMVTQYTESITVYSIVDGSIVGTATNICTADIRVIPSGGGMWEVSVEQNKNVTTFSVFSS